MTILVLNPGGNSLKAEVISCQAGQKYAFEGTELVSLSIEGIGKEPRLLSYRRKKAIRDEPVEAADYAQAADRLLARLEEGHAAKGTSELRQVECVGVRVVHGGPDLIAPTEIDSRVEQKITELERLAPLHNKSSIDILGPVRRALGKVSIYGVFDTAFHRTIPEHAALYAIPLDISAKHQIRRYGFHGISHRYMLERYAHLAGKPIAECSLITMHLESGCSITSIQNGRSIDNSMGMTPLEGLMMGTRSGDIDPSLIPLLVRDEGLSLDQVMTLLNKKSGLRGVSGISLDTRILMQQYETDARAKLAMDMFAYRVRKAAGAHLAALGTAQAVVFGGGIAENTGLVRERVCTGLRCCGLEIDRQANERLIDLEGRLSTEDSRLQAWVIPAEEGLQIAHECQLSMSVRSKI